MQYFACHIKVLTNNSFLTLIIMRAKSFKNAHGSPVLNAENNMETIALDKIQKGVRAVNCLIWCTEF